MLGRRSRDTKARERTMYVAFIFAICVAVLVLGGAVLRAALQVEKARQQTVFDATWTVAQERTKRLDEMIIAQDRAVIANVDLADLSTIADSWLPTAQRETPTVRAILVVDLSTTAKTVRGFVSGRPGPGDDRIRRLVLRRLIGAMDLEPPFEQLRHLHHVVDERDYLLSYWQFLKDSNTPYLVVAWHDVSQLVEHVMPQLYRDRDSGSQMNVVDQEGRILFGKPIGQGSFSVGLRFPTTLYRWRLQVALTGAKGLAEQAVRQRMVQIGVVGFAVLIALFGIVIVLRAAAKERRLAALKSEFVANVSHELKTPLASVRMFGEMLLTGRVANEEKRLEYLRIIVRESERLTNLLDTVLDFAKVEKGKAAYTFSPGDLVEPVGRAIEVLQYRADRQDVELKLDLQPASAVFDSRAVELAVINLIDNALKYAEGTSQVIVAVIPGDESVTIRVEDQGSGIAAKDQARIFDRFVRGRHATDAHVRGSGIGLALVKHIAESHGGTVSVQSPLDEENTGTRFEMTLLREQPR